MEQLVSARELADMLGVSKTHIRWLIQEGQIPECDFAIPNGQQLARGWRVHSATTIAKSWRRDRRRKRGTQPKDPGRPGKA